MNASGSSICILWVFCVPHFGRTATSARFALSMRHRGDLVEMACQHVQHMQKALTQMNVQIHHVISDLTGLTGLAMLDAIVAGERDPATLAKLRDPRIKASEETIRKSLEGNWRPEHVLVLKQRLSLYRHHLDQIGECDRKWRDW